MSDFYNIRAKEGELGPFTLLQLKEMEEAEQIGENTPVKGLTDKVWSDWGVIRARNFTRLLQLENKLVDPAAPVPEMPVVKSDKSRGIFIILGILCGSLGFHNFYAGHYAKGFIQFFATALLGIATGGFVPVIIEIWAIFDVLMVTEDGAGAPLA